MSQQNVTAMRRLYDAFNKGDLDTIEAGYHPKIEWNEAENFIYADRNPYQGFPAIRDGVFNRAVNDFDGFRLEVDQLLDAGDKVVATGRYRGTCKATGKELSNQFAHIMTLDEGGKVTNFQQYADTLHAAEVTGLATRTKAKAELETA